MILKLNNKYLLGFILTSLMPMVGVIYTLIKVDKKNKSAMIFNIAFFTFLMILNLSPYQDLYRRYTENYLPYNSETTYSQAISGHIDILFYIVSLAVKKIGLSFAIIPAISSAISIALFMLSSMSGVDEKTKNTTVRWFFLCSFLIYPIFEFALGIRWGLAASLALYSYFCCMATGRKKKGILFLALAVMTHASMIILIPAIILSGVIKINRLWFLTLSITMFFVSTYILPFVLSNLGAVGGYFTSGYAENDGMNDIVNRNEIVVTSLYFLRTFLFLCIILSSWSNHSISYDYKRKRNLTLFLFLLCCLSAMSIVAFRRYVNDLFFFFLICIYFDLCFKTNKKSKFILIVSVVSFLFKGVYLQRRPIEFSEAWIGLYKPAPFYILINPNDYHEKLRFLNENGDWIGHEIGK